MKRLLFGVLASTMLFACAQKGFKITGTIDGLDSGTSVIVNKIENGRPVALDTVKMESGTFSVEIDTMQPQLLVVVFDSHPRSPLYLFGCNSDISLTGNIDKMGQIIVTGGKETELFYKFNRDIPNIDRIQNIRGDYSKAQMSGDTAKMAELRNEADILFEEMNTYKKDFLANNTDNAVGVLMCLGMMDQYSTEELQGFVEKFDLASLSNHMYVVQLKGALEPRIKMEQAEKATAIGQVAPAFKLKSSNGEDVSLESYKGKFVLVDFWASWCAPCRQENPNVVNAYKKFSGKNFEVLSVSTDQDEAKWLEAVSADQLSWTQVRDSDGEVSMLYGIQAIPSSFLLDKDGVIIARNLRGDELEMKLQEVLD